MVERRSGHVVNVASMAGKVGSAKMGAYYATKHAIIGLTDSIRQELNDSGVMFTIVNPGFIDTGMIKGTKVPFITHWIDPQRVADAVLEAVKKDKEEICVPRFLVRFSAFIRDLCSPRLLDTILRMVGGSEAFDTWEKDPARPF